MDRLLNTGSYAADFFSPEIINENQSRVIVTFNHYGQKTLEGFGWGGQYFLGLGYSILAIKTTNNDWYQKLSQDNISSFGKYLNQRGFSDITAYGTSMGGYAATAFAASLGAKAVIAFSPQYSIWESWDTRWAFEAQKNPQVHNIRSLLSPEIHYYFVYDPFDRDVNHIKKFKENNQLQILEIKTPFYGHPCVKVLYESGILAELNQQILIRGVIPNYDCRKIRRNCFTYYETIAERLIKRGSYKLALGYLNHNLSGPKKYFSASKMRLECILKLTPEIFLSELLNALNYAKEDGNLAPNYLNIINANFQFILRKDLPIQTNAANLKLLILLIKMYGSDVESQQEISSLLKNIDVYLT